MTRIPRKPSKDAVKAAADRAEARAAGEDVTPEPTPLNPAVYVPLGRPSDYTKELAVEICEHLIAGHSLASYCRQEGKPGVSTVYRWLLAHKDFRECYARAREDQTDTHVDEIVEIADTEPDPKRARNRIWARQWIAERMKPRKYGAIQKIEHTGKDGERLMPTSEIDQARRVAFALGRTMERQRAAANVAAKTSTKVPDAP
jgi:hypothetical protein